MESAPLFQARASSSVVNNRNRISISIINQSPTSCRFGYQQLSGGLNSKQQRFDAVRCVTRASESADEEEEVWMRVGRCKERKGIVELLECLETEAIMGEDQGREPNDYNRRAHIFDKSSRVFQALKGKGQPTNLISQSHRP